MADLDSPEQIMEMLRRFSFGEHAKALARKVAMVHSQALIGDPVVYGAPLEGAP